MSARLCLIILVSLSNLKVILGVWMNSLSSSATRIHVLLLISVAAIRVAA